MDHCRAQAKRLRHLSSDHREALLARITPTLELEPIRGSQLVIEAVFEDSGIKARVTREVEPLLGDSAIFASNTSAIPITDLAKASTAPDRFIGWHFFSPVEKMPLLEMIRGAETSEDTLARSLAFARDIKKTVIVVNDGYGFYTSRVFAAYISEGAQLVAEGHDPRLVEWAAQTTGMVVPPLKVIDEVSLQLVVHAGKAAVRYIGDQTELPGRVLMRDMVEKADRRGKAHGAGFYDYADGRRRGLWPGLREMARGIPDETGVDVIARRLMLVQAAEVARCLDEGIVRERRDAEVGAIFGIGFAPNTGGPLAWMDRQGIPALVEELRGAALKWGERYAPAPSLVAMAERGERFFDA